MHGNQLNRQIQFSYSHEISDSWEQALIEHNLKELVSFFREDYQTYFPTQIHSRANFDRIMNLSESLLKLKACEGFEKHLKEYKNNVLSTSFVTLFASFLQEKASKLVLEPHILNQSTSPDILISIDNEDIYFECKFLFENPEFYNLEEHEKVWEIISQYLSEPHQLSIIYKKPLSETDLHKIGESLRKLVPSVTQDGTIIDNDLLTVNIIRQEQFGDINFSMVMRVIQQDKYTKEFNPGHAFYKNGFTIVVIGPKIEDYGKILINRIKKSSSQAPKNAAFILVISSNSMLGEKKRNLRAINKELQPNQNTRFSGILLANYHITGKQVNWEFDYLNNPYAKHPVKQNITRLFS